MVKKGFSAEVLFKLSPEARMRRSQLCEGPEDITEGDVFVKVLRLERFGCVRGNKRKKKKGKSCVTEDREGRSEGTERHLINLKRQERPAPLGLLGHEKKLRFLF